MKSVKLVLLLALSFVSLSQNIFSNNSREIASTDIDCINCGGEQIETKVKPKVISETIKKVEKVLPVKSISNKELFANMKKSQSCGEFFEIDSVKFNGRLEKDQSYHVKVDPMYSDIEEAPMAFMMNLPEEGKMKSSKSEKPFLGKTYEGDLMMVEKVFNGKKVIAYNVTMSLCKVKMKKKKIIHEENKIEEMAFGFVALDDEENCGGYYDIDAAKAGFVSNPESAFKRRIPMEKEFMPIQCD